MAERTVHVCDTCGKAATEAVTIATSKGKVVLDVCSSHLNEILAKGRRPRRGRPKNGTPTRPRKKAAAADGAAS